MIDASVPDGLGNRVAAMANGLSHDDEVLFRWRENEHCPCPWKSIFPEGIPGVRLVTELEAIFPRWFGRHFAHDWDAAADRAKADAAYGLIMGAMVSAVQPGTKVAPIGVFGRFHRSPNSDPAELAARALRICGSRAVGSVVLLSDLYRTEITQALAAGGIDVVVPRSKPLLIDLERSPSDILDYVADWRMLAAADLIVATDGPSSALHPIRAAGTPINYGNN